MRENPTNIVIFCDGGSKGNPGPGASSFIVKDEKGKIFYKAGKCFGHITNNQAEYYGVILALEWLTKNLKILKFPCLNFYLDSNLLVNQLSGRFKIKNQKLQLLTIKVKNLEKKIPGKVIYHFVRREKNREADAYLNQLLAQKL